MKDRIIEMLERGERVELECIDPDGFARHGHVNERLLSHGKFIIKGYSKDEHNYDYSQFSLHLDDDELRLLNICRDQAYINEFELEYFKIKDPEYTFNDLIDVAVQAAKDGFVIITLLGDSNLIFNDNNGDNFHNIFKNEDEHRFKDYIALINSLYTETFVIERESDISKITSREFLGFGKNSMSVATLQNGNEILVTRLDSDNAGDIAVYMRKGLYKNYLDFEVLKGATVTQKRGNQCNK